eukprot:TRINITY_DN2764_c0_g1_i1.p1 TRINITY_DN2764_c0_g1~~TRINITY_DN2764_c0_g1_i1.p1  ORF type:complete len:240 (-),score=67.99 TRINITY_DN2764_c0_g1_i1:66-740(-)
MSNTTFKRRDGDEVPGYLAGDSSSTSGVVVIQEWWGMNNQIKKVADEFGKRSFRAIIPDLYRGKVATDHETANHYMGDLNWPGAVQDIQGAVDHLRSLGCTKVGVTGFCMGGALTLAAVANCTGVDAGSCFYGIPGAALFSADKVKVPIQLHFGNDDPIKGFSDPEAANKLEEQLKAAGAPYEFYRYENAAHAFTNAEGPNYKPETCQLALWDRTVNFFKKQLA